MSFYLTTLPDAPQGFVNLSTSADWVPWIRSVVPQAANGVVRNRMISNIKHILVSLEMKAALIVPHVHRGNAPSILFEPYCQILTFEFCVGTYSVCEALGSIYHIVAEGQDGSDGAFVCPANWITSLAQQFAPNNQHAFGDAVRTVKSVRDRLHQDRLGLRENIDWHAFENDQAFRPAKTVLGIILGRNADLVPETTNLIEH